MKPLVDALERRDHWRQRRQLPCALLVDGRRHRAILRELSPEGLFVLTREPLPRDAGAIVILHTAEGKRFLLEASISHQQRASLSLESLAPVGVGLRIQDPPAAYLDWLEGVRADGP
jgi:hypothetical protein